MPDTFDPYRKWLGISAPERPPNHYRLLGIEPFEADEETISHAAERRIAYLRGLGSDHAELRRRVLDELTAAKACLLNGKKKSDYDRRLRATLPALPPKAPPIVRPAVVAIRATAPLGLPVEAVSRVVIRRAPRKSRHKTSQTTKVTIAIGAVVLLSLSLVWLAGRQTAVRPDDPTETSRPVAAGGSTEALSAKVIYNNDQGAGEAPMEPDLQKTGKPSGPAGDSEQKPIVGSEGDTLEKGDASGKSADKTDPAEPTPNEPGPTDTQAGTVTQPAQAPDETQERQFAEAVNMTFIAAGVTRWTGNRPVRAELEATAESIKKAPEGLAAPKYGILSLADQHWPVIVDEPEARLARRLVRGTTKSSAIDVVTEELEARPARLYVDTNGDGDLTNDPATTWALSTSNGLTTYQGQAQIDLGGERLGTIRLYRFDPTDPQRAQLKNSLFFYPDFGYEVTLNLDGRPFSAFLSGPPTANSPLAVDRNGDMRISGKRETVHVNKPFNYTGTTYVLTLNASQLALAKATPELPVTLPPPDLTAGKPALPFTTTAMDGATIDFPKQYAGKLVMLDFWSTWCPPCAFEAPNVAKAYEAWHDQGFDVLGVNFDGQDMADKITAFTKEKGMPWPQIYEGKMWATTLGELYDVNSIPFALLVDGDSGQILAAGQELRGAGLSDVIGKALAKRSGNTEGAPPLVPNNRGQMVQKKDPASPPRLAAPVTDEAARRFQESWADHLQIPITQTNSIGMSFVLVPPGDYSLDRPPKAGQPQGRRATRIARAFYLAAHEVTQEAYWKVTKTNPSFFALGSGGAGRLTGPTNQHPVEQVSWRDAVRFCNALSRLEKLPDYYGWNGETAKPLNNNGYRLPGIDEWNCAASGGGDWEWSQTPATWPRFAWHQANSGGRTWPVGLKQPNAFGLFDLYGNVWEYCAAPGSFRGYTYGSPAPEMDVRRGPTNDIDFRSSDVGFRVARTPEANERSLVGAFNFRVSASLQNRLDENGKLWASSHIDTLSAVNDGLLPTRSRDQRVARFTWWPHRGGVEWLQYDFAQPQILDGAEVYWFDDRPDGGSCKPPRSWRLLYRDGERWQPVSEASGYAVDIDRVCHTRFKPVTTSAMRLELRLHDRFSCGLFEWRLTKSANAAAGGVRGE